MSQYIISAAGSDGTTRSTEIEGKQKAYMIFSFLSSSYSGVSVCEKHPDGNINVTEEFVRSGSGWKL